MNSNHLVQCNRSGNCTIRYTVMFLCGENQFVYLASLGVQKAFCPCGFWVWALNFLFKVWAGRLSSAVVAPWSNFAGFLRSILWCCIDGLIMDRVLKCESYLTFGPPWASKSWFDLQVYHPCTLKPFTLSISIPCSCLLLKLCFSKIEILFLLSGFYLLIHPCKVFLLFFICGLFKILKQP